MNISPSINNHFANKANLPVAVDQPLQSKKSLNNFNNRDIQFTANKINNTERQNSVNFVKNNEFGTDKKASSYQENITTNDKSTNNINPNLLDKVFKLKSKEEEININPHRRSDLYTQTEIIASPNVRGLGIGLDIYV